MSHNLASISPGALHFDEQQVSAQSVHDTFGLVASQSFFSVRDNEYSSSMRCHVSHVDCNERRKPYSRHYLPYLSRSVTTKNDQQSTHTSHYHNRPTKTKQLTLTVGLQRKKSLPTNCTICNNFLQAHLKNTGRIADLKSH